MALRARPFASGHIGAPLRLAAFRRLITAYAVDEVGYGIASVALAVLVYDHTHSAVATTALFLAEMFLPAFFSPLLTAGVEGIGARRALVALYLADAAVFALLAFSPTFFVLALVLLLTLLDGTLALSARALTRASTAAVLEPSGTLREGNALLNVTFGLGFAGGPALGAVAVAQLGAPFALGAVAVLYALVGGMLASGQGIPDARPPRTGWRDRLRRGLSYVRGNRPVRLLIGGQALALVFFTLIAPIEVIYARESLHGGHGAYGALLSAWGAGTLIGSVLFARARQRSLIRLTLLATLLVGVSYLAMATAQTVVAACAAAVVGGIGNGMESVGVITALQERTAPELQARVMGVFESVSAAAPGAGFLIGGALTVAFDPRVAFFAAGGGVVLVAVAGAAVAVRLRLRRGAGPGAGAERADEPPPERAVSPETG